MYNTYYIYKSVLFFLVTQIVIFCERSTATLCRVFLAPTIEKGIDIDIVVTNY